MGLAIVAIVVLAILYTVAATRANAEIKRVTAERKRIYRGCFLRGLAGILAKMATADGSADKSEVKIAATLFADMGLDEKDRKSLSDSYEEASKSTMTGAYYASLFVPYSTLESKILVYEVLWDIAAADGTFASGEDKFLKELLKWLELDEGLYEDNLKRTAGKFKKIDEAIKESVGKLTGLI